MSYKSPFPYFGGKSRVAGEVWKRLGDVRNYVEPFFGSGAVLFARPHAPQIETVNDKCGFLANFWRSVQAAPDETAAFADWPVNETDLTARHVWLVGQAADLESRLLADPTFYDPKIAGWWCWGLCSWIGGGWCSGQGPWRVVDGVLAKGGGDGVDRQRPHLGDAGRGVSRKRPQMGGNGGFNGVNATGYHIHEEFRAISDRLRQVRVCAGDWRRVLTPSVTLVLGVTAVFLDPPYSHDVRHNELYREESGSVAEDVRQWCVDNGDNPEFRIALCGYDVEHGELEALGWSAYRWKAPGGYGNQADGRGRENAAREVIWFSPHCLKTSLPLFGEEDAA